MWIDIMHEPQIHSRSHARHQESWRAPLVTTRHRTRSYETTATFRPLMPVPRVFRRGGAAAGPSPMDRRLARTDAGAVRLDDVNRRRNPATSATGTPEASTSSTTGCPGRVSTTFTRTPDNVGDQGTVHRITGSPTVQIRRSPPHRVPGRGWRRCRHRAPVTAKATACPTGSLTSSRKAAPGTGCCPPDRGRAPRLGERHRGPHHPGDRSRRSHPDRRDPARADLRGQRHRHTGPTRGAGFRPPLSQVLLPTFPGR
jgi:hypothetical protein